MVEKNTISEIAKVLEKTIPKVWLGKDAILTMKNSGFDQWKQMEWTGFYFEFLCQKNLKGFMEFHKIKHGNVVFDGFLEVPFDFKSHSLNSNSQVIINDTEATIWAIKKYGSVVVIMALGEVEYDDANRSFQKWHEQVNGGKSKYVLERINRCAGSRPRKTKFDLKEILFIRIDEDTLEKCGSFQKNFRNADGSPRRPKVLLDLRKLNENEIVHRIKLD